jgi:hypothetical protein
MTRGLTITKRPAETLWAACFATRSGDIASARRLAVARSAKHADHAALLSLRVVTSFLFILSHRIRWWRGLSTADRSYEVAL